MKLYINNEKFKKIIVPSIVFTLIVIAIFCIVIKVQYSNYLNTVNITIGNLVDEIMKEYPDTSEEEVIKILSNIEVKKDATSDIVEKYGYTNSSAYIKKLEQNMDNSIKIDIAIICLIGVSGIIILLIYNEKQNKKIEEINNYFKQLNGKNYELKIDDNTEDELSKLRNELYKTTILLKETAENSEKEKTELSNSLADISHQLKTPLTSIRIMLDNIEDNPEMDNNTKAEFIKEISNQVEWISSLVISLLKLAKFDSGSIVMNNRSVNLKQLMDNVINNLSVILDVKNVSIEMNVDQNININVDYKWQLEAFTNIVKNSVEHSKENSKVHIDAEDNSVFTKIKIIDKGEGISKEDIKHIFERFYKAKNSSENSIGIGLSLAKAIIEKENGYIKVDSKEGQGSCFEIKYLK